MRECATTLAAEMTSQEHDFLLGLLRREKFQGSHLEMGTAAGGTLCQMMLCYANDARPRFVVVDPMRYFPGQREAVKQNLANHGLDPKVVDFREATSSEALKKAEAAGERFDFMLIDACHKIMPVTMDLRWLRLLAVGGVACFHDFSDEFPGVQLPVKKFLSNHPHFSILGQGGSILALRKTRAGSRPEVALSNVLYAAAWYVPLQLRRKLEALRKVRGAERVPAEMGK